MCCLSIAAAPRFLYNIIMGKSADIKLVKLCIKDDPVAWKEFSERFKPLIKNIIRKKFSFFNTTLSAEDLEDVTSNTIQAFIEQDHHLLKKYNPEYSFATWIAVVTATHCNRFVRRKKLYTVSSDQKINEATGSRTVGETIPDTSKNPLENAEADELAEKIKRLLVKLNPRDKLVITMLFYDELSYKEIASALRIPDASVGKVIFRAKLALKEELKKQGITGIIP